MAFPKKPLFVPRSAGHIMRHFVTRGTSPKNISITLQRDQGKIITS